MITREQTAQQKDRLPRGWGRFGKAIDHLIEVSEPDERLLAACVTINPEFHENPATVSLARVAPLAALSAALSDLGKATNCVLAVTDKRVLVIATGVGGAPRTHVAISPSDGLEMVSHKKREIVLP